MLADPRIGGDYGIKGSCALNKLRYWHSTENNVSDLMHDFLEGVGPFEVKLVLWSLITKCRLFTLNDLNSRISNFLYGPVDSKNKPSAIPNIDPTDHGLKQNAFQFYCLFRLLPQLIGDLIPIGNEHWEFYLELSL